MNSGAVETEERRPAARPEAGLVDRLATMRTHTVCLLGLTLAAVASAAAPPVARKVTLLQGQLVPEGRRTEVTWTVSGSSVCSSVFVGPRVVLTAAHCIENGGPAIALDRGKRLYGRGYRHPDYPGEDVDLALVLLKGARHLGPYASVTSTVAEGESVDLFGQGCYQNEPPVSDGKFRRGVSRIDHMEDRDLVLSQPGGAVACFGDSGGPVFRRLAWGEGLELVGIISKGNMEDRTYAVRVDQEKARAFIASFASDEIRICGVNLDCPLVEIVDWSFDWWFGPPIVEELPTPRH